MKLRQCPRERKIIIRPKLQLRKNPLHHHPIGESCPFLYVYPRSASVCAAAAAESLQSCPTLCDPTDSSLPGFPSLGFSRQEHWSGLPFPPPMHESEKWKWSRSVVSDSSDPMDCSPPGSSNHGIFQARVLEWGAIAFSVSPRTTLLKKTLWAEPSTAPPPLGRAEPNPQTLSIASVWADQPGSTAPVWPVRGRGKRAWIQSDCRSDLLNLHNPDQPQPPPPFTSLTPRGLPNHESGNEDAQAAAMSEAYFRVESGALGPEENFLSLDDILMSHEKLSVRTEIPMPRLGAFFLDRSGGAETDNAIPEVSHPVWKDYNSK